MTDKQIRIDYKKLYENYSKEVECYHTFDGSCNKEQCFTYRLLQLLQVKEQECKELKKQVCGLRPELKSIINKTCFKYNIEAKAYHEKIVEIIKNLDKYKQTLAEIKPILKFYANSNIGEEQPDKTYKIMLNGSYIMVYDPKPARQALQKISKVKNDNRNRENIF